MNKFMLMMAGINMVNQSLLWFAGAYADKKITPEEYAQLGASLASGIGQMFGMQVQVNITPIPAMPESAPVYGGE